MAFQIKNTFSCHENWENMSPTERGKFCGVCSKEVIDFTILTKNEIGAVFKQNNYQPLCARALTSQLNTIYLEESLENVSWNLPFWQRFLLIFLVCFGPEFFNVQLVFAQDTTAIQTQELVQDSVQINDSLCTDVLELDSNLIVSKNVVNEQNKWVCLQSNGMVTYGSMIYVPYRIPDDQPFSYLENGFNILEIKVEEKVKIENSSKELKVEKDIIAKNELRPIRTTKQKAPSKKQTPEPLLFVPLTQSNFRRIDVA